MTGHGGRAGDMPPPGADRAALEAHAALSAWILRQAAGIYHASPRKNARVAADIVGVAQTVLTAEVRDRRSTRPSRAEREL